MEDTNYAMDKTIVNHNTSFGNFINWRSNAN
jgi:hypothetical protein